MPKIHFSTSGKTVEFPEGEEVNILRMSIIHDGGVPYKCGGGYCGTDKIFIEEGAENLNPVKKREIERLGDDVHHGYRLSCQTFTKGDVTISWVPLEIRLKDESEKRLREYWLSDKAVTKVAKEK